MMRAFNPPRLRGLLAATLAATCCLASAQTASEAAATSGTAATPSDSAGQASQASRLDMIRRAGVMRVGILAQAPWAMLDKSGRWVGFDIDVAQKLAADMGVRVEFVRVSWLHAADDVAQGHVDIVAGLWPGPRRALVVNFSEPYAQAVVTLVAHRGKAFGLNRQEDFNKPEIRLGVQDGGLTEHVARSQLPRATIVAFDSDEAKLQALHEGKVHALVARTPVPEMISRASPKLFVMPLQQALAQRSEAFAVARGDTDMLAYLSAWRRHAEDEGWLPERRAYWFNSLAWQSR